MNIVFGPFVEGMDDYLYSGTQLVVSYIFYSLLDISLGL